MRWSQRRQRFRALLGASGCVYPAPIFDPISALIAEEVGFELSMLAGSSAALSVLGMPDNTLLTLTEFAGHARNICRVTSLPLLVDADHGYGNALNVQRTIEELEVVGVAAVTIEDTQLPFPFGAKEGVLVSLAEGTGKMKAAVAARTDPDFIIVARTSAFLMGNEADALARLAAYEQAGVDALFIAGFQSLGQLDRIAGATSLPLIAGGKTATEISPDELAARRVRICMRGHQPLEAAVGMLHSTFLKLSGRLADDTISGKVLISKISSAPDYTERAGIFLGREP